MSRRNSSSDLDNRHGVAPVTLRQVWRRLHLWIGIAGGVIFALLGLSGSSLVYEEKILSLLYPQVMHVPVNCSPAPPSALLATAQAAAASLKGRVSYLRILDAEDAPVRAAILLPDDDTEILLLSPCDATVIGPQPGRIFAQLFELHTRLLLGRDGRMVVGWIGVALMLTAISGLVIWWPRGRQWRRALQVQWNFGWFRRLLDLHKVGGALIALPFLLQAVTGAAIAFREPLVPVMLALGGSKPARVAAAPLESQRNLDQMAAEALRLLPGGRITLISPPARADGPVRIRLRMPGEVHQNGRSYVLFNASGAVIEQQNALALPTANMAFDQLPYPLHTAELTGAVGRLLLFVTGLLPALLFGTGLYLWLKRRAPKRA